MFSILISLTAAQNEKIELYYNVYITSEFFFGGGRVLTMENSMLLCYFLHGLYNFKSLG